MSVNGIIKVSTTPKVATLVYDEGMATLMITGSGGEANAAYRVLSATDMTVPLSRETMTRSRPA